MKEDLIEPERIRAIQELFCGFLLDKVINRKGEFYSDQRIRWVDLIETTAGATTTKTTMTSIILLFGYLSEKTNNHGYL